MGNPIAHSLSPVIHTRFARQLRQPLYYQALLVAEDSFAAAVRQFLQQGGKGCNITLPFKQQALKLADTLSPGARQAGAVNTFVFDQNGGIVGESTDGLGLMRDLDNKQIRITNQRVLLAGAGGAAHSIMAGLLQAGPASITLANRTVARAEAIAAAFSDQAVPISCCPYEVLAGKHYQRVFNATSAGLLGAALPLPDGILDTDAVCYDLSYGQAARPFLHWAERNGAAVSTDGLGMLVEQAAESFYLWRGVRPATAAVLSALIDAHSPCN